MPLILGTNSIKDTGYDVDNSMRLDSGSSSKLSKTFSGDANSRTTFTISAWFKRSKLGATQDLISAYRSSDGFQTDIMRFGSTDDFEFYAHSTNSSGACDLQTNRLFRDVGAWYHVVVRVDTTQGTASNRVRIYVNGTQETSFSSSSYMNQNGEVVWGIGSGVEHTIGAVGTSNYFGGYVAEVVYLDGQSLDADSFGEFDSDSPTIWKPKDVSGLTFANNSFYLDFGNSSELGTDVSGRSNSFTENNIDAQDQSTDTCTNNFATMNPLASQGGSNASSSVATFTQGNLVVDAISSESVIANFGVDTGKWFWEVKVITDQDGLTIGGVNQHFHLDAEIGFNSPSSPSGAKVFGYYGGNGNKVTTIGDGSQFSSYGNAISVNDIIGIALNLDDDEVTFYLNGAVQNSGTAISLTALESGELYFPAVGNWSGANVKLSFNFGSPHHSILSGNADSEGFGNFEHTVPSGYFALCTKNLAEYG